MRFRVVGIHPDSGEGIDIVIEAPDLAWAQRMTRQRGIVIDSIDPAPPPRPPDGVVRLNRRSSGGSTMGGRVVAAPVLAESAACPRPAASIQSAVSVGEAVLARDREFPDSKATMTHPPKTLAPGQRYDKDYAYDTYDEAYYQSVLRNEKFRSHAWRLKWVDDCLNPGPGDNIVDLGCGPGVLAKHLASKGATVHGVDLSEVAVAFARDFNKQYPNASFAAADASNCTHLESGSFNKALSADVTEHCGYDVMCDIFREAYRLLKPGGLYFVYTPNPKHWIELCRKHHFILKPFPGHTGLREAPIIIDALQKAGFELVSHPKPPSMIPVFQWFERLWSMQPLWPNLGIYRVVLLARKPAVGK